MSSLLGVPVGAAYHLVTALAAGLPPLPGGLAVAAAIVLSTVAVRLLVLPFTYYALRGQAAQARLAPQVQALRQRHARDPERLHREITALQAANGASVAGGCLPLLLQWPFVSVMYLLFRSPVIGGSPNMLLAHSLFGARLGSHWLGGAGPVSAQGAVFAALFVLLAVAGWVSARVARRTAPPADGMQASVAGVSPPEASAPKARQVPEASVAKAGAPKSGGPQSSGVKASGATAGRPASRRPGGSPGPVQPEGLPGWIGHLVPYLSTVIAAFLPLAAGLCLLTVTACSVAERTLLRPTLAARRRPPSPGVRATAR